MDVVYASIAIDPTPTKKGVDVVVKQLDRIPKKTRAIATEASKSFKAISSSIFSIKGAIISAFAGLSFASIIGEGRKFGAALGDLSAITGATGADLQFLADKSREFGKTTTLTAVEAAQAFKLIASAKPDLLESGAALAEVTEQAIILAEASGQDLPAAASALGASLNQFSSGAENASRFLNVLAEGSKRGAASIAETSEALKFAGVVAADAGLSFETTVAAIQQLSKVAIKGGEAGTGLRNVILRLAATGERDLDPAIVGLSKALENLNKKQLSTVKLTEIFGLRSVVAAKSLLNQVESLRQLETQVTGTNTALEQQSARVNNLDGDIKQLGSAVSDLKIGLELAADEGLRSLTQGMTDFFRSLGKNIDQVLKMAKSIGLLIASFAGARLLGPLLGAVVTGVIALTRSLGGLRLGMIGAQAGMAGLIGTLGVLKGALALLGGPVGAVLFAVGAIYTWISANKEATISTEEYASSVDALRTSMANFTKEKIDVVIKNQRAALKGFTTDLEEVQRAIAKAEGPTRQRGPASAKADARLRANEQLIDLRLQEQEITNSIAEGELLIGELQEQRLNVVDPSTLKREELDDLETMADLLDELSQRGRSALDGIFPEQEQINKLKDSRNEIQLMLAELNKAPDAVRKELAEVGVTAERLTTAYNRQGEAIEELQKKSEKLSGVAKDYKAEIEKVDKALWLSAAAAENGGRMTQKLALAYEFAEGKLKKLAGTTKEAALVEKVAQLERQRLTAGVVLQTEQLAKANKFAAIAAKQGFAVTQTQLVQYELTEGALKDLNDEKVRGALIRQTSEADRIALVAEAKTIKDALHPLNAYNAEVENLTRLHAAGALSTDDFTEAVRKSALQNNQAAQIIRDEFGTVFGDLLNGTKSVSQAFVDMGDNIIKSLNDLIGKKVGEQLFDSLFNVGAAAEGTTGIAALFGGGGAPAAGGAAGDEEDTGILDKIKGAVGSLFQGGVLGPDAPQGEAALLYTTANPLPVRIVSGAAGGGATDALQSFMGPMQQDNAPAPVEVVMKEAAPALGGLMGPMQQSPAEVVQGETDTGFASLFADLGDGARSLWDNVGSGFDTVIDSVGSGFGSMVSGLSGLFSGLFGGGGGGDTGSQLTQLAAAGIQAYASSGGGAASGGDFAASDFMKGLPGFAGGGDFRVGGGGGIDSQLVAFRASPNERVKVTRPQDGGKGASMQVNNTFNITATDGNVSESTQKQIAGRVQTSIAMAQRRTQ